MSGAGEDGTARPPAPRPVPGAVVPQDDAGAPPGAPAANPAGSDLALVRRARRVHRALALRYPDARCELDFTSPFELLVATVLSAQTTDVRVNSVTPELFAAYPTPVAMAGADRADLERILRPVGFFRAKALSAQSLAARLVDAYAGEVPVALEELVTLPGVGRKTAHVVRGDAFGLPGLTVDTHVGRLSRRLGWTTHDDPVRVEADLAALFPRKDWTPLSHRLIFHGRRTCHSRRPACGACPVARDCPSRGTGELDPVRAAALVKGPPAVPPAVVPPVLSPPVLSPPVLLPPVTPDGAGRGA